MSGHREAGVQATPHAPRLTPRVAGIAMAALLLAATARAQELEPRALVNAPVGMNFLVVAGGYLYGNLLLDPALPLEDGDAKLGSFGVGYLRSVGVLGHAGKVGLVMPFATGTWQATLSGRDTSTARTGLGDPVIKMSVNFIGSPALTRSGFRDYRQSTVAGISMQIGVPLGQYYPDRLVNLGSNRWSFAPRLGLSQVAGRWVMEAYAGALFYTANDDFYGGKHLTQDPLFDVQTHAIYLIRGTDLWTAVSAGYGWGGSSTINGTSKSAVENVRLSALIRVPLARGQGLKLVYINGLQTRLGSDFDTIQLVYQYAWGGKS
jgi:outer membrane putative beta-barrel porin/alpha-amylase